MERQRIGALFAAMMAALIIAVDFLFFERRFWERLMVNMGIVLVFTASYFKFRK